LCGALFAGCGNAESGAGLERIKAKGTLILATESTYPPFQYLIVEDGKTINAGLDVDLMRAFAESIGVELVVHEMAFDSIIPAVQAGTADMGGSFTPTPDRAEAVDFSAIYYYSNHNVIVRKGESDQYPTIESFQGKRLGAQKGTVQEQMIQEMEGVDLLGLPKVTSLIQELINGNIDGILADFSVADTYVAAYPDSVEKAAQIEIPDESGGVAMCINKGQEDLLAELDKFINDSMASGEIDEMYDRNLNAAIDQILEAME
jgi:polar amino acid transport system substrate-binding protein